MRLIYVFIVLIIAGIFGAILYPWAIANFSGRQIGSFNVYDHKSGFHSQSFDLVETDTPIGVIVDLVAMPQSLSTSAQTELLVTVKHNQNAILEKLVKFTQKAPDHDDDNGSVQTIRNFLATIDEVQSGGYEITAQLEGQSQIRIDKIDVILRANISQINQKITIGGVIAILIGIIGVIFSFRSTGKKGRNSVDNTNPVKRSRWGRQ